MVQLFRDLVYTILYSSCLLVLCFSQSLSSQEVTVDTLFTYFNRIYIEPDTANISSHCILPLDSSSYLVAGTVNSLDDYKALYLRKVNLIGETLWVKILDDEAGWSKFIDKGTAMIKGHDENIVLCYVRDDESLAIDFNDSRVLSFNPDGDVEWEYNFATDNSEVLYAASISPDGGYVFAGVQEIGTDPDDQLVIKLDGNGAEQWAQSYEEDEDRHQHSGSIVPTSDGGYILGGSIYKPDLADWDQTVLKIDSEGEREWFKSFGTPEYDYRAKVLQLESGNYLLSSGSVIDGTRYTIFAELDLNGDTIWTKKFDIAPSFGSPVTGLVPYLNGYVGTSSYLITQLLGAVCIVRLDENLDTIWTKKMTYNTNHSVLVRDVEITPDNGIILCGMQYEQAPQYSWLAKLDSLGHCCSNDGPCDSVIVKIDSITSTKQLRSDFLITLWPNPVLNQLHVQYFLPPNSREAWLRIYDQHGMEVRSRLLYTQQSSIELDFEQHLASGVYVYVVEIDGKNIQRGKLVKT